MTSASMPAPERSERKTGLEWALGLFADVRPGEVATALLLAMNVLFLFIAYYFIKPLRESFVLQGGTANLFGWSVGKPEIKSYSSALMAVCLVFVVGAYARLAAAVPRHKLITFVTLFFISNLVVFFALAQGPISVWLGIGFFVWVGIFNNMVVSQFWAFANDLYSPEEGKRLFPIVGFGASSGAVVGSWLAGKLVRLGEAPLLLLAAALLGVCILITNAIHHREVARRAARGTVRNAEKPVSSGGGFQLVFNQRYLLLIALLLLVSNLVNTNGEFILSMRVKEAAHALTVAYPATKEGPWIAGFYASYQLWTSVLTAVLQLFVVSRVLKYGGVRAAIFILPAVALCGYGLLMFGAAIGLVRIVKIVENSCDYSVQNTARQALFLPTSREVKYKAKAAIDTFFVRIGDFSSAILVFIGTQVVRWNVEQFALINFALVVVWVAIVIGILRHYGRLSATAA